MISMLPFFTIGHSNRTFDAFAKLLNEADIDVVVDIRRIPRSRANPQFNQESISEALSERAIAYEHVFALGGLRGRTPTAEADLNVGWENKSFRSYADYALTETFHAGFERLLEIGDNGRSVIMCSEALWWRCHRRIVSDYLIAAGRTVFHILGPAHIERAHLTPFGIIQQNGSVLYPAVPRADV